MSSASRLRETLPGLTNAHAHGAYGPQFRGVKESRGFELGAVNLMARELRTPTPAEFHACALVTGLENLEAGTTSLIEHYYGPLTREYVYAVANAYEEIGLRAWVLLEFTDLPWLCYTREAYPSFSNSVPEAALPPELRSLLDAQPRAGSAELEDAIALIGGWTGERVRLGLALGNPTWCSDGLIAEVAAAADDLGVLLTTHVNESAMQRRVSLEQWNLTAVERLQQAGALSERTILSHAIQITESDIRTLAEHGTTISYNPISNLKLRGGFAQVGEWVRGGVNVCLGSCGQSSRRCAERLHRDQVRRRPGGCQWSARPRGGRGGTRPRHGGGECRSTLAGGRPLQRPHPVLGATRALRARLG